MANKGGKPAYRAATPVEYEADEGQKTRWTNIGVAFENKNGITVLLDALPVNGKIYLSEYVEYKKKD